MVGKKIGFISILLLGAISSFSQSYRYLQYIPSASIKIDDIIKKYHLKTEDKDSLLVFNTLNASSFLENGNIRHCVNFPDAALPRIVGSARLAVANSNVPNMVGQISAVLAGANLNISELLNKSRGEYAYTLIDAEGQMDEVLLGRICAIEGVLSARLL